MADFRRAGEGACREVGGVLGEWTGGGGSGAPPFRISWGGGARADAPPFRDADRAPFFGAPLGCEAPFERGIRAGRSLFSFEPARTGTQTGARLCLVSGRAWCREPRPLWTLLEEESWRGRDGGLSASGEMGSGSASRRNLGAAGRWRLALFWSQDRRCL